MLVSDWDNNEVGSDWDKVVGCDLNVSNLIRISLLSR